LIQTSTTVVYFHLVMPRHVLIPCYACYVCILYYLACYVRLQVQNMPYYMRLCTGEGFQNRAFRDLSALGEGLRISKGPILKPFFGVKNWLNFFHLLFLYAFFCYFLFLCPNPSRYFPLLSFCAHLFCVLILIFFFMHVLFFFQRTIQGIVSLLSLNKAKVGASSLPSFKFMHVTQILYFLLPTFLSFIFFFNSFSLIFFFLFQFFQFFFF
jgi:hypothetical protein